MSEQQRQKLSSAEITELINYVADNNEQWSTYERFCEEYGISPDRRFSPQYWKTWLHRKRERLQERREKRLDAIRRGSNFSRERRLAALEDSLRDIEGALSIVMSATDPDSHERLLDVSAFVKLEEQKRKTLEAIAKERGEYAPKSVEEEGKEGKRVDKGYTAEMMRYFRDLREAKQIEARVVDVE